MELQLRQKYSVNLVLIKRSETAESEQGSIINVPMPDTVIFQDDLLMLAGADLAKLPQE